MDGFCDGSWCDRPYIAKGLVALASCAYVHCYLALSRRLSKLERNISGTYWFWFTTILRQLVTFKTVCKILHDAAVETFYLYFVRHVRALFWQIEAAWYDMMKFRSTRMKYRPARFDLPKRNLPTCTNDSWWLSELKIPTRTYTKENPYQCEYCQKCFSPGPIAQISNIAQMGNAIPN